MRLVVLPSFVLLCCALPAPAQELDVRLAPLRTSTARGDEVLVRVTLRNTGAAPRFLLSWQVPLGEITAPLFEVLRDGQPVRYLGMLAKRPAPGPDDYLRIEPGAALSATVELSALYEMHVTGSYQVRYRSAGPALLAGAPDGTGAMQPLPGSLVSNPVEIWVEGRLPRGTLAPSRLAAGAADPAFPKCSNAQQEQLGAALGAGRAMARDAQRYLDAGTGTGAGTGAGTGTGYGARYATWFGAPDAERVAAVRTRVGAIRDAFENRPVAIDCGCKEKYFAYVYPAQPYTVYVCKAFWSAPLTGTDSRGGTLLHELSHFDVVAGTDDHVYGKAGAAEMARSDPARAVRNADSYEYFGENAPPQR
ncbi:M35 family metallo-endopeptidase [Massilia sp. MS-15]|uniref:M35 family metallo-endopeptidase n=1 Tax=Massilia sp. MS-15 TaxID=2878200 RepID=UPI001CD549FA|nr:M35 family metallo-endopeptidase [Massilia sp. MS-15]MCA1248618.1 peptidase M35 [Massilia sp. MS-15]